METESVSVLPSLACYVLMYFPFYLSFTHTVHLWVCVYLCVQYVGVKISPGTCSSAYGGVHMSLNATHGLTCQLLG